MLLSAASDLGLHCLPITILVVSRLQWEMDSFKFYEKYSICIVEIFLVVMPHMNNPYPAKP